MPSYELNLFILASRNINAHNGYKPKLRFTKSTTHVSVSRAMVDFMLNDLDLSILMKRIEQSSQVIDGKQMFKDELLMGSLNSDDSILVPGGYTHHCIDKNIDSPGLTA